MELTPKQREVLKRLGKGEKPGEIADAMGIKLTTLRDHRQEISRFYGTRTTQGAIREARRSRDL